MATLTPIGILTIIHSSGPIKAKDIAIALSNDLGENVTRRDVNQVIYGDILKDERWAQIVVQDDFFKWSVNLNGDNSSDNVENETSEHYENTVNLDSIVRVKYSNGEERLIGFKKGEDSVNDGITYISHWKPLAESILNKKVGDLITPTTPEGKPLLSCEILEII